MGIGAHNAKNAGLAYVPASGMLWRCSSSARQRPAAIRATFQQRGEFAAAVELRHQQCAGAGVRADDRELRPLPKRLRPARLRSNPSFRDGNRASC
jgi:hypothetical protein